jgi:hypothetical protein
LNALDRFHAFDVHLDVSSYSSVWFGRHSPGNCACNCVGIHQTDGASLGQSEEIACARDR